MRDHPWADVQTSKLLTTWNMKNIWKTELFSQQKLKYLINFKLQSLTKPIQAMIINIATVVTKTGIHPVSKCCCGFLIFFFQIILQILSHCHFRSLRLFIEPLSRHVFSMLDAGTILHMEAHMPSTLSIPSNATVHITGLIWELWYLAA